MNPLLNIMMGLAFAWALTGCASVSELKDNAVKFDQGVHTAAKGEMALFHQVQAAECTGKLFKQAFAFASDTRDPNTKQFTVDAKGLDFMGQGCQHEELTDAELALRQKLMDTLTLYADTLQTITNGANDKELSSDSKTEAGDIKKLATEEKLSARGAEGTSALNAAVITLVTLALDHAAYQHVQEAAAAMQSSLETIAGELKAENDGDVVGLQSKADGILNEVRSALLVSREHKGALSYFDVIASETALKSILIAPPDVAKLNATLDAMVRANAALARSKGGVIPEMTALVSSAQQASSLFSAAK
jgi:hypothetical protein